MAERWVVRTAARTDAKLVEWMVENPVKTKAGMTADAMVAMTDYKSDASTGQQMVVSMVVSMAAEEQAVSTEQQKVALSAAVSVVRRGGLSAEMRAPMSGEQTDGKRVVLWDDCSVHTTVVSSAVKMGATTADQLVH